MDENKEKFAFLIHPRNVKDMILTYPIFSLIPARIIKLFMKFAKPRILSTINVRLNDGRIIKGLLIGVFLTADQILNLPHKYVIRKILQSLNLAERLNVSIVGLGGLISSVADGGKELLGKNNVGLTTGNSYTVAISIEGLLNILNERYIKINSASFCVIGATGSIGQGISKKIAQMSSNLLLIGRTLSHLEQLKHDIKRINPKIKIVITLDIKEVKNADIIVAATSSPQAIIRSDFLKFGAIIYDISQPKNVSEEIIKERPDILVIDGGLVEVPNINLNYNILLPHNVIYSCLAETILLAAEGKTNNYSIGKVTMEKVNEINLLGKKYEFKPRTIKTSY